MKAEIIHRVLWLWIPLLIVGVQIAIELFAPKAILGPLHSEAGPHEMQQFILAVMALVAAFRCLFLVVPKKQPPLIAWVICFCLGCAYIAGEEISWGQHFLEWSTPEFWSTVNDQNETNLHNTSSWLDQKPRLILLLGVVVGGLVIPALRRWKSSWVPPRFNIIYPPAQLGIIAACALGANLLDKLAELTTGAAIMARSSEVEEIFMFYFVLLYLVALRRRILQQEA